MRLCIIILTRLLFYKNCLRQGPGFDIHGGNGMKILHILNDGPIQLAKDIISVQSKDNEIKIIDLSKKNASYESIVDAIFVSDRVISW